MIRTTFQPIVSIFEDGSIEFDWSGCEFDSDDEGATVDAPKDKDGYSLPAKLLDRLVDKVDTPTGLRNLADHIEGHLRKTLLDDLHELEQL